MITAVTLTALEWLARLLPDAWLYRLARGLAPLALPLAERRRQTVRGNLQRLRPGWTLPQLDAATRGVFQETACYYVDTALMSQRSPKQIWDHHLQVEGIELLQRALADGKGVVLAGAHLSNSEMAIRSLPAIGIDDIAVLVEPLRSRAQMAAMQRRRNIPGVRFVPATVAGVREVMETLQRGGVVGVFSDRDIQGNGFCLPFAGRLGRFPVGAVDLALRTEAALLIGLVVRERDDHFRATFLDSDPLVRGDNRTLDLRVNMANMIRAMEPMIVQHADQWRVFESPWAPCHDAVLLEPGRGGGNPHA